MVRVTLMWVEVEGRVGLMRSRLVPSIRNSFGESVRRTRNSTGWMRKRRMFP